MINNDFRIAPMRPLSSRNINTRINLNDTIIKLYCCYAIIFLLVVVIVILSAVSSSEVSF